MATLRIATLRKMGLFETHIINDFQHNSIKYYYAECRVFFIVMLSVVMLNVVMLNVVMLSVVAPIEVADSDKQASLLRIRS